MEWKTYWLYHIFFYFYILNVIYLHVHTHKHSIYNIYEGKISQYIIYLFILNNLMLKQADISWWWFISPRKKVRKTRDPYLHSREPPYLYIAALTDAPITASISPLSAEPAASFQALMRTGGWLRGIAHTLETADQRRAMRSAADRPSAACRASATGSAEGRLPASGAKSRVVATTGMGMRGSRSGAFNYSRRTIPPLVSSGDYIYEYLFASPFHARYFHRSAVSIRPTPLLSLSTAPRSFWSLGDPFVRVVERARCGRSSSLSRLPWSFPNYLSECGSTTANKYADCPERRI